MKMRITIFIFLFFISGFIQVQAQNFAPLGAEWYYGYNWGVFTPNPYVTYFRIQSVGDTICKGINCRHLKVFSDNQPTGKSEFCYENNGKIYWYNFRIDTFTVIYDFNLTATGNWDIQLNDSCHAENSVDSISQLVINQDTLAVQHITSDYGIIGGSIIQRIGSTSWLFPDEVGIIALRDNGGIDEGYFTGLRCYSDSSLGFYQTGVTPICSYTGIDSNNKGILSFSTFPNPVTATLNISFPNRNYSLHSISITNSSGKQILHTSQTEIPVSHLAKGLYFVRAEFTNGQHAVRKVVIQ